MAPKFDHAIIWVPWLDHGIEVDEALHQFACVIFADGPLKDLEEGVVGGTSITLGMSCS